MLKAAYCYRCSDRPHLAFVLCGDADTQPDHATSVAIGYTKHSTRHYLDHVHILCLYYGKQTRPANHEFWTNTSPNASQVVSGPDFGLAVCLRLQVALVLARCGLLLQMLRGLAVCRRLHISLVLDAAYCYRCCVVWLYVGVST